eukprot:CAMPEP_0206253514 /NCGR_PEP_ID=MMETSP0047_2-20121206/23191_1 /ASSEMBLY_ACC=CAM_ASM_000192 /TAXON_ID=195065 /ORGANISM="Chroomonas mesostigmatica_cf, Strain CCMP1168" /LENGTH=625 /DNA_ID=CAMNT_0053679725 /DNA_START=12 /DNA_END=1889 /DNA_ORIENTATION=-
MGLRGLAARAAVLCALLPVARGAAYGERCTKTTDCSEGARFCSFFFMDDSYERNTVSNTNLAPPNNSITQHEGVCVDCQSDCDCGVNQYCGVDPDSVIVPWATIKSNNDGNGANSFQKKVIEVYARSFEGMKIRSRCLDYSVPETACKEINAMDRLTFTQVREQNVKGTGVREIFKKVPQSPTIPRGYQDRYCGKINVFAPEFHEVIDLVQGGSGVPEVTANYKASAEMSTMNYFDTSAQCPKYVVYQASDAGCNACYHNSDKSTCWQDNTCICRKEAERNDGLCCSEFIGSFSTWSSAERKNIRDFTTRRCSTYPLNNEGFNNIDYYSSREQQAAYRSCSNACRPRTNAAASYDRTLCYDANANAATLSGNTDQQRYCQCVIQCETCVQQNGGCGKAPAGYTFNQPGTYQYLFGTCSGSCRGNAPVSTGPPVAPASDYTCPAPGLTDTEPRGICIPACIDCFATAMAGNCNAYVEATGTTSNNACPTVTPKIASVQPGGCSASGDFDIPQAGFKFSAPTIDWSGWCETGTCMVCRDGTPRCLETGIAQQCVGGRWYAAREISYGVPEFSANLQALVAAAIFLAFCFLALLGVICAVCFSKPRKTVPASGPPKYNPPPAQALPPT